MSFGVSKREVEHTPELQRILALPRRAWDPSLAAQMTEVLKTPDGEMSLRDVQGQALFDGGSQRGGFFPISVGGGKTLVSLLMPYVLEARRPLLLLPASLIGKTERERQILARHWRIPRNVRMFSYEMLGRVNAAEMLEHHKPDLIVADEVHRLKNPKAACTRRVTRYMKQNPETLFVAMSGTIFTHSLHDFAHIIEWCLGRGAPVPLNENDLRDWADALDDGINPLQRVLPGALKLLGCDDSIEGARQGFQRRMVETPGVVASLGDDGFKGSLYITGHEYAVNPVTEANFQKLRGEWRTPDDWPIAEAVILWKHARELALGLHYIWSPRPPDPWIEARRAWCKFVREELKDSRTLDSELQVANAYPNDPTLLEWQKIRPTFTPNAVPVWHDDSALKACEMWLAKNEGICWVEHTFFGNELAKRTGLPYFRQQGLDPGGRYIEDAKGPIIASVASNSTGRNLQRWNKNLVTSVMMSGKPWEQLLGRTHRMGQTSDEVTCDVLVGCAEHLQGFASAQAGARAAQDLLGASQKLLLADINFPTIVRPGQARWTKTAGTQYAMEKLDELLFGGSDE